MITIFCANKFEILNLLKKISAKKRIIYNGIRGIYGIYKIPNKSKSNGFENIAKNNNNRNKNDTNIFNIAKIFKKKYNSKKNKALNKEVLVFFTGIGKKNAIKTINYFKANFLNRDFFQIKAEISKKGIKGQTVLFNNINNINKINIINNCKENLIIICGFSGALVKSLKVKDLVIIDRVVAHNHKYGLEFNLRNVLDYLNFNLKRASLVTSSFTVNNFNQKIKLYKSSKTDTVDMETYWILNELKEIKNPIICLRIISDDLKNDLPEFLSNYSYHTNNIPLQNVEEYTNKLTKKSYFYNIKMFFKIISLKIKNLLKFTIGLIKYIKNLKNLKNFIIFLKNILTCQKLLSENIENIILSENITENLPEI